MYMSTYIQYHTVLYMYLRACAICSLARFSRKPKFDESRYKGMVCLIARRGSMKQQQKMIPRKAKDGPESINEILLVN